MDMTPLGNRVLIIPDKAPEQTESGLFLAEHAKPEMTGIIKSVGSLIKHPSVKAGEHVIFSWSAGQELWLDDGAERYLILREDDLLAVIEE